MKQSLLKNGLYNTAAGIIRIGLGLLTIPVLIRILGVEEYGLWTLAVTVIVIVTLAESGLSLATTMFVSQDLERDDVEGLSQTLTITGGAMLVLSVLAALFLWIFAPTIVGSFSKLQPLQQSVVTESLKLGAVVVWSRLLQQVLVGVEQAAGRYDLSNAIATLQAFALNIGMLVVVCTGGKTVALMQWQIWISVGGLLAHGWVNWRLLKKYQLGFNWNPQRGREIFRYSMMSWMTAMGGVLFSQLDKVIVGAALGASELGIYAAITNVTNQINVLSALPVQPMMPALSAMAAKDDFDPAFVEERVKQAYTVNSLFALGIGSILLTVAPFLLKLLLGTEPTPTVLLSFRVAVLAYSLYSVNAVGFYLCLGLNAARTCMTIQVAGSFFALALIWLGTNRLGLFGAMLGNLGFVVTWLMNVYGCRLLKIPSHKWLHWLAIPLSIVGTLFLVGTWSGEALSLKLVVMSGLTLGLFGWYLFHQFANLKSIYTQLQYRFFNKVN
jgi:O-antigen/teichoic acid export membrane protein